MKAGRGLALGVGAGLGVLLGCFSAPDITGPYLCSQDRTCSDPDLSCVKGVCCKEDGGEPACAPPVIGDGGADGGEDGGQDGGQDGGCTVPPNPACTVFGKQGPCANGQYSCATGTLACTQTVFPVTETCNGVDDNCDGVADNYPCQGGPPDLLTPGADYVTGAKVAIRNVLGTPSPCLLDQTTLFLDAGYLDGGNWRALAPVTHVLYAQKADGGTWDLSRPGQGFQIAFDGYVERPADAPIFAGYAQPVVMLCGPVKSYRRFVPFLINSVLQVNGTGFSVATALDVADGGGGAWKLDTSSPGFSLAQVSRVEVLLTPRDPTDGGTPGFDAGLSVFGFFPP